MKESMAELFNGAEKQLRKKVPVQKQIAPKKGMVFPHCRIINLQPQSNDICLAIYISCFNFDVFDVCGTEL